MKNILKRLNNVYIYISFFSILFFVILYGIKIINPFYTEWMYGRFYLKEDVFFGNDLTINYQGWLGYSSSAWRFPIGCFDKLTYPDTSSIIFSDSIPLLAVLFKLLVPILGNNIQYFGLWGLCSFILQGIMAVRILRHYTDDRIKQFIGAALFVISPIVLWRMFIHIALDSQWLILMALEPLLSKKERTFKQDMVYYGFLGFLTGTIHIYLLFFCGIILFSYYIYLTLKNRKILKNFLLIISYVFIAAFFIWILGGFTGSAKQGMSGVREYSMNLVDFFNSYGFSFVLPELPHYISEDSSMNKQYEGFCYLGMGVMLLGIISIVLVIKNKIQLSIFKRKRAIALIVCFVISLIVALSPRITFLNFVVVDIPLPDFIENLWTIFRSTGRASWILVYLIMLMSLFVIYKIGDKRVGTILLVLCLCLQFTDNIGMYIQIHDYFSKNIYSYNKYNKYLLSEDFWNEIKDNDLVDNVYLGTTMKYYDDEKTYTSYGYYTGPDPYDYILAQYVFGGFCAENNITFNHFRTGRSSYEFAQKNITDILENRKFDNTDLFVFFEYNKFEALAAGLNVYYVDGYYIGYSGILNEEYRIDKSDIVSAISFLDENGQGYVINIDDICLCMCLELPAGSYIVDIESAYDSIELEIYTKDEMEHKIEKIEDNKFLVTLYENSYITHLGIKNTAEENIIINSCTVSSF